MYGGEQVITADSNLFDTVVKIINKCYGLEYILFKLKRLLVIHRNYNGQSIGRS